MYVRQIVTAIRGTHPHLMINCSFACNKYFHTAVVICRSSLWLKITKKSQGKVPPPEGLTIGYRRHLKHFLTARPELSKISSAPSLKKALKYRDRHSSLQFLSVICSCRASSSLLENESLRRRYEITSLTLRILWRRKSPPSLWCIRDWIATLYPQFLLFDRLKDIWLSRILRHFDPIGLRNAFISAGRGSPATKHLLRL